MSILRMVVNAQRYIGLPDVSLFKGYSDFFIRIFDRSIQYTVDHPMNPYACDILLICHVYYPIREYLEQGCFFTIRWSLDLRLKQYRFWQTRWAFVSKWSSQRMCDLEIDFKPSFSIHRLTRITRSIINKGSKTSV